MADFTVEVPIRVKGRSESGGGGSGLTRAGLVGAGAGLELGGKTGATLTKVGAGIASIALILSALDFIIKPVLQILRAVLVLFFLPLIPILIPLLRKFGDLGPFMKSAMAMKDLVQKIVDFITGGGIVDFVKNFFSGIWDGIVKGFDILLGAGQWIWENVFVAGFERLMNVGQMIWDQILLPAWSWFKDLGLRIWNKILLPAWSWFSDIGERVWNIIKGGWDFIVTAFRNAANALITLVNMLPFVNIPHLAEGGIVTRPTLAVIGESGPEAVIPLNKGMGLGGTIIININNPVVREEADLRRLANMVSMRLQGQLKGRIS